MKRVKGNARRMTSILPHSRLPTPDSRRYNHEPCRGIAQLVERRSPKPQVAGSSPAAPANTVPVYCPALHLCRGALCQPFLEDRKQTLGSRAAIWARESAARPTQPRRNPQTRRVRASSLGHKRWRLLFPGYLYADTLPSCGMLLGALLPSLEESRGYLRTRASKVVFLSG